ncbi:MAG: hypothetical protein A2Y38_23805 [Spirochaetes bacterium GWB1_59_5]|nr:MAG: hypothetical protein A2Y38_23805 [Spirochaetes bacterium GWB1_59_5]
MAYTAAEVMEIAEHHYLTAAYHFYMHAVEDCANGIFRPRIGEPLTAAEVDDITASIPSGCQNGECAHHAPTFSCNCRLYGMAGPEHCGFYIDPDAGTVKPDRPDNCAHFDPEVCNCHTCHNCDGYERETGETIAPPSATIEEVCGILADRAAGEVILDITLPSIALVCTAEDARQKYHEERDEWLSETVNTDAELIEMWDVFHSARTWFDRTSREFNRHADDALKEAHREIECRIEAVDGILPRIMAAKAACLLKNAQRGYYAPEVNAAILASSGHSWTVKGE